MYSMFTQRTKQRYNIFMENFIVHAIKRLVIEGEISKIQEPIQNIQKNINKASL